MSKPIFSSVQRKGFSQLTPPSEVRQFLTESRLEMGSQMAPTTGLGITDLVGRVLARNVDSPINVPAFPKAMMDGFAVQSRALASASKQNPITLSVTGTILAGDQYKSTDGRQGESLKNCIEIMTGSSVPAPFDSVLPFECVEICYDPNQQPERISVPNSSAAGKHIAPIGEDILEGQTVFTKGHQIRNQDLGIFPCCRIEEVELVCKPKVDLFLTGDEIRTWKGQKEANTNLIFDSNGPVLSRLINRDGGNLENTRFLPDDKQQIKNAITESPSDILLFCGGTSAGIADHLPDIVRELGELFFHGVDIKPGRPIGIGKIQNKWIFLLPGNPIACYFCYDLFVRHMLILAGKKPYRFPYTKIRGILSDNVASKLGRLDYLRVKKGKDDSSFIPITTGRSSNLSTIAMADGFCLIPEEDSEWKKEKELEVWLY